MKNSILQRLSIEFSVRDIMTPARALQRASFLWEAESHFHIYDVVAYPGTGEINSFFLKGSDQLYPIQPAHLVSDGTSLFEIIPLFRERPFYFVLAGNRIDGYLHYSDLNKSIAKIPFFVLFQTVEKSMWDRIEGRITHAVIARTFPEEAEGFIERHEKGQKKNVDIEWTGIFSFGYILKLARFFQIIQLPDEKIDLLKEIRNKTAHSDQRLVETYEDVDKLVEAYQIFLSLIPE